MMQGWVEEQGVDWTKLVELGGLFVRLAPRLGCSTR